MNSKLAESLFETIQEIEKEREEGGRQPSHALLLDVVNKVYAELEIMQQNGFIRIGRTINDKYITTNVNK